jgi:xylulokinase
MQREFTGKVFLGLDLGTSYIKASLYDETGKVMSSARAPVPMLRPSPGHCEQSPDTWWDLAKRVIAQVLSVGTVPPSAISAVGCCGQSHGPTPYSNEEGPLANCITWVDERGREQVQWLLDKVGEQAFLSEGNLPIDTCYTAVKLLWLKENRPTLYRKTEKFLLPKDVLVHRMTGQFSTDFTDASVTNLFSSKNRDWSAELLSACGLDKDKLPPVNAPWDIVGEVTPYAAQCTGLSEGTPVIAGAADWACLYYGAGGVRPNVVIDLGGTVGGLVVTTEQDLGFPSMPSVIPDLRYSMAGTMEAAAVIYEWYVNEFFNKADASTQFDSVENEIGRVPAGAGGLLLLPHFAGRRRPQRENARGGIFGLSLATTREQIGKAVLEGVAFETRRALERIRALNIPCSEIRSIGGAARSRLWRQIKSDILGIPFVKLDRDEVGAFGVAMLAAYAMGSFTSLAEPVDRFVHVEDKTLPNEEKKALYDMLYKAYCELSDLLDNSGVYDGLAVALKE